MQDGAVYAWGANFNNQLGDGTSNNHLTPERIDPTDLTDIVSVASSGYGFSAYALAADGTIWDWGSNSMGQLGLGNNTTYLTPQHLVPPTGYAFTAVTANEFSAVAILTPTAVPEPAGLSMVAAAVVATGRVRRRKTA